MLEGPLWSLLPSPTAESLVGEFEADEVINRSATLESWAVLAHLNEGDIKA